MHSFAEWLRQEMAVQTHPFWSDDKIGNKPERDGLGIPKLQRPGFRPSDKVMITRDCKEVEQWVDAATSKLGVHWLVCYIEPDKGIPETPSAASVRQMKIDAKPAWAKYTAQAQDKAQQVLQTFSKEEVLPPPDAGNTIVYVKSTSRVHGLSKWQCIHNMGHAIWNHNPSNKGAFVRELRDAIFRLQQQAYDPDGKKPTWSEMVIVLARLLDLKSFQRVFSVKAGDLDTSKVRANTALNSIMEAMFELVAVYLKNKGRIPLRPRGEAAGVPDRTGEMEPNAEVVRKFGVRPWVWKALASDASAWAGVAEVLNRIVEQAILNSVYAKAGPIYATQGYITTEP